MKKNLTKLILLIFGLTIFNSTALAVTFTVTGPSDTALGSCMGVGENWTCDSLRDAIVEANNNLNGPLEVDVINLGEATYIIDIDPAGEDLLLDLDATKGDFDITESLTITGMGAGKTIIDAQGMDRVFHIDGSLDPGVEVTLEGLTITGGYIPADPGNIVEGNGAGIQVRNDADFILSNSEVIDNINNDTSGGGGVYIILSNNFSILNSTIANNETEGSGAGIVGANSSGSIDNSTISGNQSGKSGAGIYTGGTGNINVNNATIVNNDPLTGVGGILGPVDLKNSVVAQNGIGANDVSSQVTSLGYNFIGYAFDTFVPAENGSDTVGSVDNVLDPMLSPLPATNPGPGTRVHLPLINSPLIDKADPATCSNLELDQRGEPRNVGNGCDIGAVELQAVCGNGGEPEEGEACDEGTANGEVTATCTTECTTKLAGEPNITCGNGTVEAPEECDDGNDIDDDLCSNACLNVATNPPGNEGSGGCAISTSDDFNYFYLAVISLILGWVIVRPRIVKQNGGNETRQ